MTGRNLIVALATMSANLAPSSALAAIKNVCDVIKLFGLAATWFGIFVFIVAVAVILYAGLLFMTGGGSEEAIKKAKSVLLWGLIGIAIALLATSAEGIVRATLGGPTSPLCP